MTVKVHLPEAFLGMDVALCEEQVMGGRCVNVGNAHFVAVNVNGSVQTIQLNFPVNFGKDFGATVLGR